MKVLFGSLGFYDDTGGVGIYLKELVRHLSCQTEIAAEREGRTLDSFLGGKPFRGRGLLFRIASPFIRSNEWLNERRLAKKIVQGDFDVLHIAGAHEWGSSWRKAVGKKPIVVTVYDLIPERIGVPQQESRKRHEVLSAATEIIAISENTKRDLMHFYDVPADKITVIYPGTSEKGSPVVAGGARQEMCPYVVFVGKRGGYKNWKWMVEAMSGRLGTGQRLVCTWRKFDESECAFLRRLGVEESVSARECSRTEMAELYRCARALVFPSRYEGFGLPILEAWANGCPVILSRASCFPEIGGDAALYFDLDDGGSLLRCLDEIGDDSRRQFLVERGKERVLRFTWEKAAAETLAVYEKAVRTFSAAKGARTE